MNKIKVITEDEYEDLLFYKRLYINAVSIASDYFQSGKKFPALVNEFSALEYKLDRANLKLMNFRKVTGS